ncbi:MAG: NUDIX domain-containing protein, partial [Pseudomonadota bacterium]
MLQQTTAATVAGRFAAFLRRFPNLAALAAADQAEVLHAWQGLGYYRRARALHACARAVVSEGTGELPNDQADLLRLPGIGPYSARAIMAIAFDHPSIPVDANIARILARVYGIETPMPGAMKELQALADSLASPHRPGDIAQAMMDLGAMICRPKAPRCGICPWHTSCVAYDTGAAEQLPRRTAKRERPILRGLAFHLTRPDGAILFRRRPEHGLLGGMHELPGSDWLKGPLQVGIALRQAPVRENWCVADEPVIHVFTHFVLEVTLAKARTEQPPRGLWCKPQKMHELALPTV